MEQVAESYAQQCQILKFLGFDMASIHLCYRSQMPTNHRTDQYGGSLENRARFPLMILKKIREAVGKHFIVEILISGEEDKYGGYTRDDTVAFLRMAAPYVDIAQIRASDADGNHPTNYTPEEVPTPGCSSPPWAAGTTRTPPSGPSPRASWTWSAWPGPGSPTRTTAS